MHVQTTDVCLNDVADAGRLVVPAVHQLLQLAGELLVGLVDVGERVEDPLHVLGGQDGAPRLRGVLQRALKYLEVFLNRVIRKDFQLWLSF